MKQFKTVSEFKKVLAVGDKIGCTYHMALNGRDDKGAVIYANEEKPVREVSIKQSNAFALKTEQKDGTHKDSWCAYPLAKESVIKDGKLTVMERDARLFKGGFADESNPEYKNLPFIPVLTYWFAE